MSETGKVALSPMTRPVRSPHCVAGASYDSGIYFMVLIDQSSTWSLGFQHPKWSFTNNQQFPIALTFDGQTPFYVQGVAVSESLVRVPMPTDSALIGQFRKAVFRGFSSCEDSGGARLS
jgi:hypothetical protein